MTGGTPALSRATVDRDAATREDEAALAAAWPGARVLVVDEGTVLAEGEPDAPRLVLLDAAQAPEGDRLYLGRDDEASYFAVAGTLPPTAGGRRAGLRELGAVLDDRDAGLVAHAVGLANWHRSHPCCARCGAPTTSVRGGAVRRCGADGSEHFPRTDPAVIVLVTDGADRCVLGRQAVWPVRRFSTLAGFVEPGESLEQAVVREVAEEAGLAVREVVYRDSQPWPFPASLMLGFRAVCDGAVEPRCLDGELAEVAWFTRAQVRAAGGWTDAGASAEAAPLLLPPPVSIAWKLLTDWAAED